MPPLLRFGVLGPVRVGFGDARVEVGGVRRQAVPLALVLRAGVTVSKRELVDGVWGSKVPSGGYPDATG